MTIDNDGPIIFLQQGSDPTPIIPVDKTCGSVLGGAKMTYVAFEGMIQRPFALAFDEPRLFEALSRLMAAINYENSHIVPLFHAEELFLETRTSDAPVLRIKMKDGASIAFRLDDAVFANLKDLIKNS
jgi:hypothetical protein